MYKVKLFEKFQMSNLFNLLNSLDMKPADNLPPIQHPFNSTKIQPYKQEDLPPIQKQLHYIDKR